MKNLIIHLATFTSNVIVTVSGLLIKKISKALSRNKTKKIIEQERE